MTGVQTCALPIWFDEVKKFMSHVSEEPILSQTHQSDPNHPLQCTLTEDDVEAVKAACAQKVVWLRVLMVKARKPSFHPY